MEDNKLIFVSYRRDDKPDAAGRLADALGNHFGEQNVFQDVGSIESGVDFVEALERALEACAVMLVVIGSSWVAALKEHEQPGQEDYSRREVATALERNVQVIPVLVQGASMPSTNELPSDLAGLTRRQAMELHYTNWKSDVTHLITRLQKIVGEGEAARRSQVDHETTKVDSFEPLIPKQVGDYGRIQAVSVPKDVLNESDATDGVQATYQTPYGAELKFDVLLYSSPDAAEKAKQHGLQRWESAGSVAKQPFTIESAQSVQLGTGVPMVSRQGNELTTWTDGSIRASTWAPAEQFGRDFRQALYSQHWAGRIRATRRRRWFRGSAGGQA